MAAWQCTTHAHSRNLFSETLRLECRLLGCLGSTLNPGIINATMSLLYRAESTPSFELADGHDECVDIFFTFCLNIW